MKSHDRLSKSQYELHIVQQVESSRRISEFVFEVSPEYLDKFVVGALKNPSNLFRYKIADKRKAIEK